MKHRKYDGLINVQQRIITITTILHALTLSWEMVKTQEPKQKIKKKTEVSFLFFQSELTMIHWVMIFIFSIRIFRK